MADPKVARRSSRSAQSATRVTWIITDLRRQALMERFLDALWGEIARFAKICDSAGVDDAKSTTRCEEASEAAHEKRTKARCA